MAEPQDSATTLLTDAANALKTVYHPEFHEMIGRFGKATGRLLSRASKRKLEGGRFEVHVGDFNAQPWVSDTNILSDFPTPEKFGTNKFYVNVSEDESENDTVKLAGAARVSDIDIARGAQSEGSSIDFVEKTVSQFMSGFTESLAIRNNILRDGKLFTINGTPKQNDARTLADASATPAAGTGARAAIDGGSIATARPNLKVDIYTGNTKDYTARINDANPADMSVGFWPVGADGQIDRGPTGTLANVADNDDVYLSGQKDKSLIGIEEWFNTSPSSGEDFFGKDRTDSDVWYWMRPHQYSPNGSTVTSFALTHIDSLFTQAQFIEEEVEGGFVVMTTPALHQAFRDEVGNDALIMRPSKADQGRLIAHYGFDGLLYRHPMARFSLEVDPLMQPNKIRFLRPGTWELLSVVPGNDGRPFRIMPGMVGGMWNRIPSATPGNGFSMFYQLEGYTLSAVICTNPRINMELYNVSA